MSRSERRRFHEFSRARVAAYGSIKLPHAEEGTDIREHKDDDTEQRMNKIVGGWRGGVRGVRCEVRGVRREV